MGPVHAPEADVNRDGVLNSLDVPFVKIGTITVGGVSKTSTTLDLSSVVSGLKYSIYGVVTLKTSSFQ